MPATFYFAQVAHRVSYRVYYEDTDSIGVVYYANYFKFLERGRTEHLRAHGHDVVSLNAGGLNVVVHKVEATFRKAARLGDMIDVVTSFGIESAYRGRFRQRIEREGVLLVDADVDVVCTNVDQTLIELPEFLRATADE